MLKIIFFSLLMAFGTAHGSIVRYASRLYAVTSSGNLVEITCWHGYQPQIVTGDVVSCQNDGAFIIDSVSGGKTKIKTSPGYSISAP